MHFKWNGKVGLLAVLILGLGFLGWSYLVGRDVTDQFDFNMTVRLQDEWWATKLSYWLKVAQLGNWQWSLGLLVGVMVAKKRWSLLLASIISLVIGASLLVILRFLIPHPSPPFMFYQGIGNIAFDEFYVHLSSSFPSGHAFRAMFVGGLLGSIWSWRGLGIGLCLGLLVGIAQVILGYHWTTDVIGGWILGAWGAVMSWFIWKLGQLMVAKVQV